MEIEKVAELFNTFVGGDPPCSYNNMDEFTQEDDWCQKHCMECEKDNYKQCWIRAIKEGWIIKSKKDL